MRRRLRNAIREGKNSVLRCQEKGWGDGLRLGDLGRRGRSGGNTPSTEEGLFREWRSNQGEGSPREGEGRKRRRVAVRACSHPDN